MAKSKTNATVWSELLAARLYKRNQGRITRQSTAAAAILIVCFGLWTLSQGVLSGYEPGVQYGIPLAVAIAGAWLAFRMVNYPRFADFLISVEAEMDKVSWPSWAELKRATIVVLGSMIFLGLAMFVFDLFWQWFFRQIGFLRF